MPVKSKVEISQNFVAFSEYVNFTKMGANGSAGNTPNAPEFVCPCTKVLDFNKKGLHWASLVRGGPRAEFGDLAQWPKLKVKALEL